MSSGIHKIKHVIIVMQENRSFDTADINGGGPHGEANAIADVDGGQMDGFIRERDAARKTCANAALTTSSAPTGPASSTRR